MLESQADEKMKYHQGMWVFLGSEILFFSGLFLGLVTYRHWYPQAFAEGSHKTTLWMGAVNTFLLLTSSWLVAEYVEKRKQGVSPGKFRLLATALLGLTFLGLKFWEYADHYRHGLFPGSAWHADPSLDPHLPLFFFMYFFITGIHALHLLIGIVALFILMARKVARETEDIQWENFGLYWHFVDIIWVFLFTIFYLGVPPR